MDDLPDRIEHTVLGPTTRWADVDAVLATARDLGMRACIPPRYVERAAATDGAREGEESDDGRDATVADDDRDATVADDGRDLAAPVPLTTVIDFPHGQGTTAARCAAAKAAWEDGAAEIDVVVNVGRLLAGEDAAVREDLEELVASVPIPVKLIVEAPLLADDDLHRVGELAADAGVDYLKTATGFSDGGATVHDVDILAEYLPVKASGGVGSWEKAEAMFEAGAERIGASSGDVVVEEWREATGRE